jgi:hypothetical protein
MVAIASWWQTRQDLIVRALLVLAALVASGVVGLRAFLSTGDDHGQPPAACTAAACVTTQPTLPGGWVAENR